MIDIIALRQMYKRRELFKIRQINSYDNPADSMTKQNSNTALETFVNTNRLRIRVEGWVKRTRAKVKQSEDLILPYNKRRTASVGNHSLCSMSIFSAYAMHCIMHYTLNIALGAQATMAEYLDSVCSIAQQNEPTSTNTSTTEESDHPRETNTNVLGYSVFLVHSIAFLVQIFS